MTAHLPTPDDNAIQVSKKLIDIIKAKIKKNNNWISFADYMQIVLYEPRYGYYTGGSHKIGAAGDFITAPTLTPLFTKTLTTQIIQLLPQTAGNLYEFGAGTGDLALGIIEELHLKKIHFNHYYIIEISPELKERQQNLFKTNIPSLLHKIIYLETLPDIFDGIILGNEVLDAIPCERICWRSDQYIEQIGVTWSETLGLVTANKILTDPTLLQKSQEIPIETFPYESELHTAQQAFIITLAEKFLRGAMIWVDYGFESNQYYFSERHMGTMIGHYQHHTVHDPFFYPGLCDLTCHVNFTAIADSAIDAGMDLAGYTTQAHFLINLGLTEQLSNMNVLQQDTHYLKTAKACQILLNEHEMGELFKVIGFCKGINNHDWLGFSKGDRCHKL